MAMEDVKKEPEKKLTPKEKDISKLSTDALLKDYAEMAAKLDTDTINKAVEKLIEDGFKLKPFTKEQINYWYFCTSNI